MILNPAPASGEKIPRRLVESCSLLTPNRGEIEALTGVPADPFKGARKLLTGAVEAVVVTLGAMGAAIVTRETEEVAEPFRAESVDTVGAGDAFNGALAASLAGGTVLREALRTAMAAGALACAKKGARPSMPRKAEIAGLLRGKAR